MRINLSDELWDILNPDFDGHLGYGEFSPSWMPLPNIIISPIMTYRLMDVGQRERKSFIVYLKDVDQVVLSRSEIEITPKCVYLINKDGERTLLFGENVVLMNKNKVKLNLDKFL